MSATDDAGVAAAWWRGLTPPAVATVSAWATTFRQWGTRTTAAGGRYALERVPYLREPMDALSEGSGVQRVVVMKASRLGFTEGLVTNLVGYVIHEAPGPILIVVPTRDVAMRLVRESIEPMCQATPEVAVRLGTKRGTGLRHATLYKEFPRGSLTVVGARSAAGLRQTAARYLVLDDLDGCPRDVEGEGTPVAIAEARARTYGLQRKMVLISSPTTRGRSLIEAEYLATDQRCFLVACVHCGHRQRLVLDQLTWTPGQPETAVYTCVACRAAIGEGDKPALLAGGTWVATATRSRPRTRGYHLSTLYSPSEWCTWAELAREAEAAAADPVRDRTFRNTFLGVPIVERYDVPDWQRLRERQTTDPLGLVPDGALFLTAGIDVQRDRVEFHLWGWGRDRRRWLVDVRVCDGDIETDAPWTALRTLIDRTWPTAAGDRLVPLTRAALDTRFRPARVQAFAKTCPPGRVELVEGMARLAGGALVGHYRQAETTDGIAGRRRRRTGLRVWPINTGALKAELYGCLNLTEPGCAGWISLPAVGDQFCRQLVAEALVRKRVRGGREVEGWERVYRDNHALDCAVYARVAAYRVMNQDRFLEADWRALEAARGLVTPAPTAPTATESAAPEAPPAMPVVPPAGPAPQPVRWRRSRYWGGGPPRW